MGPTNAPATPNHTDVGVRVPGATAIPFGTGGKQLALSTTLLCQSASEGGQLTFACPAGSKIVEIPFASCGWPKGDCAKIVALDRTGQPAPGAHVADGTSVPQLFLGAHSATSTRVVQSACLLQGSCNVQATDALFGNPALSSSSNRLFIGGDILDGILRHAGPHGSSSNPSTAAQNGPKRLLATALCLGRRSADASQIQVPFPTY